jgi:hypothetical protein
VAGAGDVGLGVLAELSEELMDAGDGGFVAFDLAGPAAFGGVLDESARVPGEPGAGVRTRWW